MLLVVALKDIILVLVYVINADFPALPVQLIADVWPQFHADQTNIETDIYVDSAPTLWKPVQKLITDTVPTT